MPVIWTKRAWLLFGLLVLSLGLPTARAQDVTATIRGSVRDASGGALPGVTVVATNVATTVSQQTLTSGAGEYVLSLLPVGTYTLTVELPGFKKFVRENIVLHVNDNVQINAELQVGAPTETVLVTESVPLVQTETHQVEGLITGAQIRELPLNNRNFAQLTVLVPGVSSLQGSSIGFGGLASVSISINGNRTSAINWSVDGSRNVDTGSNVTLFNYPSVDAIEEFKILTNSYDAQFGRNGGGVVNIVTRSGGKNFHGGVYEFLRNDRLQARDPFQTTPLAGFSTPNKLRFKPPLRYNNFGWNLGGPVWIPKVYGADRNRTFFFFSQEFRRIRQYSVRSGQYPTAAERQGLFSTTITDPLTGQPFLNNTIPATRIDSNARIITDNLMPLPNQLDIGPRAFRTVATNPFDFHQELIRVDHNFTDRVRIWGRYMHDNSATQEAGGLFNGLVNPGVATTNTVTPADNFVARLTTVITPRLMNEVGYDFSQNQIRSVLTGRGLRPNFPQINIPEIFPGSPSNALPAISITDISSPTGVFGPYKNNNPSHTVTDNFTASLSRHTIRAGLQFSFERKNENAGGGSTPGSFSFTGRFTGNAYADFLLGLAQNYTEDQTDVRVRLRYNAYEWYVQDSWKARPNLTVDMGLRHSMFQNPTEVNNILVSFLPPYYDAARAVRLDPTTGAIVPGSGDRFNGVIFAGGNSPFGRYVQTNSYNTFGPRVGFAWDPWSDGKTALRGGYGIYYDRGLIGIVLQNSFADPRPNQRVSIDNTFLSNPAGGAPNTAVFPLSLTTTGYPFKVPMTQHWSLGVQRQLWAGSVFEVTYVGSGGNHLLRQVQLNQPLPFTAGGRGLNFVRPYQGFGSLNQRETTATSRYHSLQAAFHKRLSKGFLMDLVYTWGRAITDASNDRGDTPQNSYNYRSERGPALYQRKHIFTANYLYEVPFPRDAAALLKGLFGGWQVGGTTYFWSGRPLTVTQGGDLLQVGGNTRPNLIGNVEGPKRVDQWFSTDAFTPATTTFGTAGRGILYGPGVNNWDISLVKNFRWSENYRVRFSADLINAFNHTQYDNPNTGAVFSINADGSYRQTNANFGKITGVGREARIVQFGLKLNF